MGGLSLMAALKVGLLFNSEIIFFIEYIVIVLIFGNILLLALYDLRHFIIPDIFLISLFILSFIYHIFFTFIPIHNLFLVAVLISIPFLFIFIFSRGAWIGLGDVKYIFVLSFFLGLVQGVSAILFSFWIGAAFSILILSLARLKLNLPLTQTGFTIKSEIPFGPFLSMGIILSFYLNVDLLQIHSLTNLF
jgi:Flp pilus assembly protein protease CpaA